MRGFERLYEIAAATEQLDFVRMMDAVADAVIEQKFVNVVVTGMRNSGKTTFINEIAGSEVWEPGNMDDNEKPLRVSFEQIPDDETFQCIFVQDDLWREKGAVIYELREENLVTGKAMRDDVYPFDIVFFLISATAPFRLDDLNYLKMLAPLRRQVVVNEISNVGESEREKVLAYIDRINGANGFPPVIVMGSKNFSETVRELIPSGSDLQNLRAKKVSDIFNYTLGKLEQSIQSEIEANAATRDFAVSSAAGSIENQKISNRLGELRIDVMEYRKRAGDESLKDLDAHFTGITAKILSVVEKSELSEAEIQKLAEKEYVSEGQAILEALEKNFRADLNKVGSAARILGVADLQERVEENLKKLPLPGMAPPASPFSRINATEPASDNRKSILIGTGIVAGGLLLSPLPTIVSVAGSFAAAAGASAIYVKNKNTQRELTLTRNLREAFKKGSENIKTLILDYAEKWYGEIISQLKQYEEKLYNAKPDLSLYNENEARLKALLEDCHQIKNA